VTPQEMLIGAYLVYGMVSIGLTLVLARTLFRNGAVFLHDVFARREGMAEAVNRLLVIGFYMLNLGYAFLILRSNPATDTLGAVELLVEKLGVLLVSLGAIHFVNMLVFWRIRRQEQLEDDRPPLPHDAVIAA